MENFKAYVGSVRFFKNLILLLVIVAIIVPTGFAIHFHNQITEIASEPLPSVSAPETSGTLSKSSEPKESEPSSVPESSADADVPAYQQLYPDFYAPQPYQATERAEQVIYLTFDDGPSENTERILQILQDADVKATFFVVGQTSPQNIQRMKMIADAGHTVGMHSYSHRYTQIYESVESFLEDMYQIFTQIKEVTGTAPTVFRFPGGSINAYNGAIYQEMIAEMIRRGFVPFDWNLSAQDAVVGGITSEEIVANVVGSANSVVRGVVLMHDSASRGTTAEALPTMISELKQRGFSFAALTPQVKPVLYSYKNE